MNWGQWRPVLVLGIVLAVLAGRAAANQARVALVIGNSDYRNVSALANPKNDARPIATSRFPSNWELSAERAISVVKYMSSLGVPPERLVPAGFGEFHPIDGREDAIAYRRNRRIEFMLTDR